jgi:hypothetical protein
MEAAGPNETDGPLNDRVDRDTTALIPKAHSILTPAATVEEIAPPK